MIIKILQSLRWDQVNSIKTVPKSSTPWRKMKTGPLYEISHTQPLISAALLLEVEMVEW